ncbi:MAG: hypothetical protein ACD_7C00455G0006, partial [uncultured bacterium]
MTLFCHNEETIDNNYGGICLHNKKKVERTLLASGLLSKGKTLEDFLQVNKMAGKDESIFQVLSRATDFLARAGSKFYGTEQVKKYQEEFLLHTCRFEIILGSPILTNAGRREEKSISACSIPSIALAKLNRKEISRIVSDYHIRGMGTGFCLDDLADPAEMIIYLNEISVREVQTGKIERSVGNMGVLSIDHPKIHSFIKIRINNPEIKEWKFNLSVKITDNFMKAWINNTSCILKDGSKVDPNKLIDLIAQNAHATGDPGIIFMDRINDKNRLPQMGKYRAVVPCGEVSLFEGEICQFLYLNLPRFVVRKNIDLDRLRRAIHCAIVMLDNAVEANIEKMPNDFSSNIVSSLRRIGLGVCGVAELFQALGKPYDSDEARSMAENIMSVIQFESKCASVDLAQKRGPFAAFTHSKTKKDLFIDPFAIPTRFVSMEDWQRLKDQFDLHGIRNLST